MKRAVLVLPTCERPGGVDYLSDTLASVAGAGGAQLERRVVLVDGKYPDLKKDTSSGFEYLHHLNERAPMGIRYMMWAAFGYALAYEYEALIFCEDDVRFCKNAITRILSLEIPDDVAFMDFYDMTKLRHRAANWGLHKFPCTDKYWGNQCMLFPARTMQWLYDHNPMEVSQWELPNHADRVLGHLLARSPWPNYMVHLPRLVRHMGEVSVAHPDVPRLDRMVLKVAGDDFDAASLSNKTESRTENKPDAGGT